MKDDKRFEIPFSGLKDGKHHFDQHVDNTFFESYNYDDFNDASLDVQIELNKKPTFLEFDLQVNGTVNVNCDLTNEPYDQPIAGEYELVVKYGDAYNDEHEDLLIIPHGSHKVDIAQYVYELIVLAVPRKCVHPGIADGTLKSDILDKLEELQPRMKEENTEEIDPRWEGLKGLLDNKNG